MDKSIEAAARVLASMAAKMLGMSPDAPSFHFSHYMDEAEAAIAAYRDAESERLNENIKTLLANHQNVRAKLEAAERDAARYRWLRGDAPPHSTRWVRWDIRYWTGTYWDLPRGKEVDDSVDTAMREEAARGGERG